MGRMVASIDFGTNTARLLIAEMHADGSFSHVHIEREIVRMGGGFCRKNGLSPEAVARGKACLARFSDIMRQYGVNSVNAVATSAVRDAVNGAAFVEDILSATGIRLNVIDGEKEARLTLAGVLCGLDQQHPDILLFDIGGGSTEYSLVRQGQIEFSASLPLGVVRLTEGKVTIEAMRDKISRELAMLANAIERSGHAVHPEAVLIGTAGTATTLAAINMRMVDYDYRKVNNSIVTKNDIESIYARLLPLTPQERLATTPGLEKGREDLIIAGMLITMQTLEKFALSYMKVSDYGLLEGLVVRGEAELA